MENIRYSGEGNMILVNQSDLVVKTFCAKVVKNSGQDRKFFCGLTISVEY